MYNTYEHYQLERALADQLRRANRQERPHLYIELYDQLFTTIKDHPQNLAKQDTALHEFALAARRKLLSCFFDKGLNFVEFGGGDGALSKSIAEHFAKLCMIEVSNVLTESECLAGNIEVCNMDCSDLSCLDNKFDVAFSDNLFEHLHPEDAMLHLQCVRKILNPGGVYIIRTPNSVGGPHDVSRNFDEVSTGFHLKEYDSRELREVCLKAGFKGAQLRLTVNKYEVRVPFWLAGLLENLLRMFKHDVRKKLTSLKVLRPINSLTVFAYV